MTRIFFDENKEQCLNMEQFVSHDDTGSVRLHDAPGYAIVIMNGPALDVRYTAENGVIPWLRLSCFVPSGWHILRTDDLEAAMEAVRGKGSDSFILYDGRDVPDDKAKLTRDDFSVVTGEYGHVHSTVLDTNPNKMPDAFYELIGKIWGDRMVDTFCRKCDFRTSYTLQVGPEEYEPVADKKSVIKNDFDEYMAAYTGVDGIIDITEEEAEEMARIERELVAPTYIFDCMLGVQELDRFMENGELAARVPMSSLIRKITDNIDKLRDIHRVWYESVLDAKVGFSPMGVNDLWDTDTNLMRDIAKAFGIYEKIARVLDGEALSEVLGKEIKPW